MRDTSTAPPVLTGKSSVPINHDSGEVQAVVTTHEVQAPAQRHLRSRSPRTPGPTSTWKAREGTSHSSRFRLLHYVSLANTAVANNVARQNSPQRTTRGAITLPMLRGMVSADGATAPLWRSLDHPYRQASSGARQADARQLAKGSAHPRPAAGTTPGGTVDPSARL
jgi:hypothetical protein